MNGNNIIIYIDGEPAAAVKSDKLRITAKQKNVSSPMTGRWSKHRIGRAEWGITTDYLVTSPSDIAVKSLKVGAKVSIAVRTQDGVQFASGEALCTSCEMRFSVGSVAVGSWNFNGIGNLELD